MRVKCPNCRLYVEYDNDDFITDDEGRTGIKCIFCDSLIELEAPQKPEAPAPVHPAEIEPAVVRDPTPSENDSQPIEEAKTPEPAGAEGDAAKPKKRTPRKKSERKKPRPKPTVSEPQAQPQAVQPASGCTNGQGCGCLMLVSLIVAIAGYFFNWWGLPFLPDRRNSESTEAPAEVVCAEEFNRPSESQLINIIQLANKAQTTGITPEFGDIVKQYADAPNVVWEGGIAKPDFSPELLVSQAEQGDVLNVEILDQSYSDDGTRGEILFEYYSQSNDYRSPSYQAIAYLVNDGISWRVDDFGMDYSRYGGAAYLLSDSMKMYTEASNRRIVSGETLRDLHKLFGDRPEELNAMLNYVREYAFEYDIVIPDSLSYDSVAVDETEADTAIEADYFD